MESELDEVRGGLTEKVAFEQSPGGGEGAPVAAGGGGVGGEKSIAGRGNSKWKALESEMPEFLGAVGPPCAYSRWGGDRSGSEAGKGTEAHLLGLAKSW